MIRPNDVRVRELLSEAMSRPAEARQAFLDAACVGDAALRAEVQGLLSGLERAGEFLSDVTVDQPDRASVTTLDQVPISEGPGTRIGRYKLLQLIGEGGFGSVFMAEQEQPVRRRVALKIIKLGMDTKQVIARFEAERQALAMMDHTHIARVFDAGATETGRPYFVMELVRGVPITEYCDSQNLSTRERLELFIPVCNAVQHAHQKGIIHRDIKPSNVMVTMADGKPVPKIIDFGIAKATNARLTEQTYFTEYRQFIGTPQYMSPEQAEMSGIDIDTRSDIYSLGVLLYELLTGTTPLDAKALRSQAYEEMRRMIRDGPTPRPSTKISGLGDSATVIAQHRKTEPRKLGQLLRGELDWIVMRALEKDRTRRYDTAGNLAADIQRHLDNEPVLAKPPSATYAMRKFVSRHRIGMLAGGAVLMALLVGFTLATVGFFRANSERDIAVKARTEAQTQKEIADKARIDAQSERKLAIENARKSDANARDAKLQLAIGLVSQADALRLARRFTEARQHYIEAVDKFAELKESPAAAEAGLWSLYRQTKSPLMSYNGHDAEVTSAAIAPDGRTAVSGSANNILKVWDLASGKELRSFSGHTAGVSSVAIAPDGRTALSGSFDKTLKLWDLQSGKVLFTFTGHSGPVTCVSIAPDGHTAISGSYDKTLKLWDLASGRELRTFTAQSRVNCVAIAPDGRTALSGGIDKTLKLWDLSTGDELRSFTGHTQSVMSVAIAPDGRTALSGSFDRTLKLWDLATGKELRTFAGHTEFVSSVTIAPDGQTALSGSYDGTIKLWDLASGDELRTFTGHASVVLSVAVSRDGRIALSGSWDKTLKLWSLAGGKELRTTSEDTFPLSGVAIAPDGRTALSSSFNGSLKLWDLSSCKTLHTFTGHSLPVTAIAIAPDGRTALSGGFDKTLKLWELGSGKELRTITGHAGAVSSVAIAPDGRTAISGSTDKTLKVWDLASGKELRTLIEHTGEVTSVAIAPDGRTALSASSDLTLRLWDLANGQVLRTFTGHTDRVCCVAIAPGGRIALSGAADKTLKLWDLATGRAIRTLTGHTGTISSVAIATDGRTALSGSFDRTLKLWDLSSGKELCTFGGHSAQVSGVSMAADGQVAVSSSFDKTLKIWDFAHVGAQEAFELRVDAAQERLRESRNDGAALATLGEWYAFHGLDQWAIDFLIRAREGGAAVAPLVLARCYWNLNRNADARREFQVALDQSKDASERTYLSWCIAAIESDQEHKP